MANTLDSPSADQVATSPAKPAKASSEGQEKTKKITLLQRFARSRMGGVFKTLVVGGTAAAAAAGVIDCGPGTVDPGQGDNRSGDVVQVVGGDADGIEGDIDSLPPAALTVDKETIITGPNRSHVTISGTIPEPEKTEKIEARMPGDVWEKIINWADEGKYEFDYKLYDIPSYPFQSAVHAVGFDGKTSEETAFTIESESIPPKLPTVDPTPIVIGENDTEFNLTGEMGIDTLIIKIYHDTENGPKIFQIIFILGGPTSSPTPFTWMLPIPAYEPPPAEIRADGFYPIIAQDDHGNRTPLNGAPQFEVVYTAPTIYLPALPCAVSPRGCDRSTKTKIPFAYTGPVIDITGNCTVTGGATPGTIKNIQFSNGSGTFDYIPSINGRRQNETIRLTITGPGIPDPVTATSEQTHRLL